MLDRTAPGAGKIIRVAVGVHCFCLLHGLLSLLCVAAPTGHAHAPRVGERRGGGGFYGTIINPYKPAIFILRETETAKRES